MNGISAAFEARVSRDPEFRYTREGKAVCNVGVGVPDGKGGVEWVRVALWEQLAEEMQNRLEKGVGIYVEGRLTLNQWTGQDGQPRSGINVNAWKCEIIGLAGRRSARPAPDEQHDQQVDQDRRQRIAAAAAEGIERAAGRRRWSR